MNTSALDPKLLITPNKVQTDWHVLTGIACVGKTTLITQLADQGFQIFSVSVWECLEC